MERVTLRSEDIKRLAKEAGFDLCGVVSAECQAGAEKRFRGWLLEGYGDGLDYLHRNLDLRFDPTKLVDGARSVVVCGVNYKNRYSLSDELQRSGAGVASYALMRDYHKTIKRRLKLLLRELQRLSPELSGRMFTDSAPLVEKHFAYRAGLGWIGRQSLLVTPQFGTFVLLGELVIDHAVDRYDEPLGAVDEGCGECRRCLDSCPVGAINRDRTIDARRCIAARTIEFEQQQGSEPLAGWIFGCDVCQRCCPHNRLTPLSAAEDLQPKLIPPSPAEWLAMSETEFVNFAQGTPIKRSSLTRIKDNIALNSEHQNR
ncbi:MAG: tRNA epoxyqueuosine(34) reductase QueG [Rikenellaceae bacterium]